MIHKENNNLKYTKPKLADRKCQFFFSNSSNTKIVSIVSFVCTYYLIRILQMIKIIDNTLKIKLLFLLLLF
jgi:hypothetical protein